MSDIILGSFDIETMLEMNPHLNKNEVDKLHAIYDGMTPYEAFKFAKSEGEAAMIEASDIESAHHKMARTYFEAIGQPLKPAKLRASRTFVMRMVAHVVLFDSANSKTAAKFVNTNYGHKAIKSKLCKIHKYTDLELKEILENKTGWYIEDAIKYFTQVNKFLSLKFMDVDMEVVKYADMTTKMYKQLLKLTGNSDEVASYLEVHGKITGNTFINLTNNFLKNGEDTLMSGVNKMIENKAIENELIANRKFREAAEPRFLSLEISSYAKDVRISALERGLKKAESTKLVISSCKKAGYRQVDTISALANMYSSRTIKGYWK